jgi:hypothetical protein
MFKRIALASMLFQLANVLMPAQGNASMSAELKRSYTGVKNNILNAVAKMPEDGFAFKPTPDIRPFAQVIGHVTEAQTNTCSAVLGESPAGSEAAKTSKADVISALKASFDKCDKAYDSLTDANASSVIKTPRGERTRLGALVGNYGHDQEQWGILSVYLRLKGIRPTGSE